MAQVGIHFCIANFRLIYMFTQCTIWPFKGVSFSVKIGFYSKIGTYNFKLWHDACLEIPITQLLNFWWDACVRVWKKLLIGLNWTKPSINLFCSFMMKLFINICVITVPKILFETLGFQWNQDFTCTASNFLPWNMKKYSYWNMLNDILTSKASEAG